MSGNMIQEAGVAASTAYLGPRMLRTISDFLLDRTQMSTFLDESSAHMQAMRIFLIGQRGGTALSDPVLPQRC